jgi:hypothetical protein
MLGRTTGKGGQPYRVTVDDGRGDKSVTDHPFDVLMMQIFLRWAQKPPPPLHRLGRARE